MKKIKIYLKDKTYLYDKDIDKDKLYSIINYKNNLAWFIFEECKQIRFAIPTFKSSVKETDNYIYINHFDKSTELLYNSLIETYNYLKFIFK